MAINYYFAADGAFGEAVDGCTIDVAEWGDTEWALIDHCSDWDRARLAQMIAQVKGSRISEWVPVESVVYGIHPIHTPQMAPTTERLTRVSQEEGK